MSSACVLERSIDMIVAMLGVLKAAWRVPAARSEEPSRPARLHGERAPRRACVTTAQQRSLLPADLASALVVLDEVRPVLDADAADELHVPRRADHLATALHLRIHRNPEGGHGEHRSIACRSSSTPGT